MPDARRQIVENARQSWIRKLIDLSRRNNLLYFRPLKTGTLELTSAPSERLHDLLMVESVAVSKLAPDLEDEALTKILRDIFRGALGNSEEKGLSNAVRDIRHGSMAGLGWGQVLEDQFNLKLHPEKHAARLFLLSDWKVNMLWAI